MYIPIISE